MHNSHYDIVIVGAGVAGAALAHALATLRREKSLRIAMVERSFSEPDRILGELLQPGGVAALKTLGMSSCTENIDAIKVSGYLLIEDGEVIRIPYSKGKEGRSFRHGRFVMNLRRIAVQNANVDPIEATVSELLECPYTGHVIGVRAISKTRTAPESTHSLPIQQVFNVYGDLVIIADGCFSNFRNIIMGEAFCKAITKSYFVGTVLKDVYLPAREHGTVILPQGNGPVLLYQISERETRIFIDIPHPLPADLKVSSLYQAWTRYVLKRFFFFKQNYILTKVLPQLPSFIHKSLRESLSKDRLKLMPNSFLPPVQQGNPLSKTGVILLGDSWNIRHPLTGGGMTVALNDVVYLRDIVASINHLDDWEEVGYALCKWHWGRKPLSSAINILSGILYALFQKDSSSFFFASF